MIDHSNLVVTAWDELLLVGVARCTTNWAWSCYLADLAVRETNKRSGIGKEPVSLAKEAAGPQSMLLLLSVPATMEYYPKTGLAKLDNSFLLNRRE